ncbi:hypothetical protein [Myxococcus xanthus]|uniref:Uncharacterized protein n=1 Tax=Myxococcus xanthus TaxID=34 RepID=A0A7Y4IN73_MYXXA|nr:hypothetical protein [Myxococcus xanthus]NOJ82329.1 hypothetical protein [Myxococcus xanthus]NOJ89834.1 hypothetical protein [Myxococcus xanthus]
MGTRKTTGTTSDQEKASPDKQSVEDADQPESAQEKASPGEQSVEDADQPESAQEKASPGEQSVEDADQPEEEDIESLLRQSSGSLSIRERPGLRVHPDKIRMMIARGLLIILGGIVLFSFVFLFAFTQSYRVYSPAPVRPFATPLCQGSCRLG